jgi:hypothetical protein
MKKNERHDIEMKENDIEIGYIKITKNDIELSDFETRENEKDIEMGYNENEINENDIELSNFNIVMIRWLYQPKIAIKLYLIMFIVPILFATLTNPDTNNKIRVCISILFPILIWSYTLNLARKYQLEQYCKRNLCVSEHEKFYHEEDDGSGNIFFCLTYSWWVMMLCIPPAGFLWLPIFFIIRECAKSSIVGPSRLFWRKLRGGGIVTDPKC